jgi:CBS-domain-containing membrane protein
MTEILHRPPALWAAGHRLFLTAAVLAVGLAVALAVVLLTTARSASTPSVGSTVGQILPAVDNGCAIARADNPC